MDDSRISELAAKLNKTLPDLMQLAGVLLDFLQEIPDLHGQPEGLRDKLLQAGYLSVKAIARVDPQRLQTACGILPAQADDIIEAAREFAGPQVNKEAFGEGQLLDLLYKKFKQYFDSGVAKRFGEVTDKRTGGLSVEKDGSVHKLGTYFPLQGYNEVVRELVKSLISMSKFETVKLANEPHAIRIIGPPGMGKSTVLSQGWYQIKLALDQPDSQVIKDLEDYPHLLETLRITLRSEQMLVFIHEVQKSGALSTQGEYGFSPWEVENLNIGQIIFLRVLHTALSFPANHGHSNYLTFADDFFQNKKLLNSLRPHLVFDLVARLAGVKEDTEALVVFAIDELEGLMHHQMPDGKVFGQELLSQLIVLRQQLITNKKKVLPIYMAASTRASASSLRFTVSAQSKVLDLHLPLLNFNQMEAIVVNIARRLGSEDLVLHATVKKVLHLLGGIPRVLEWCLVAMSRMPTRGEKVHPGQLLKWLTLDFEPASILRAVTDQFRRDSRWGHFYAHNGEELVQVLVTHDILRHRVSRGGVVPGQVDKAFTWQEAEAEGLLTLVHEKAAAAAGSANVSPPTSRRSSDSDTVVNEHSPRSSGGPGGAMQGVSADKTWGGSENMGGVAGFEEYDDQVAPTALVDDPDSTDGADRSGKYFVAMHPLLLLDLEFRFSETVWAAGFLPLLRLDNSWRAREETHLLLTVVRCSLLKTLDNSRAEVQLGEIFPVLHSRALGVATLLVKLPDGKDGCEHVRNRLKEGDFNKMKADFEAGISEDWAFLGPGNYGADSWCFFRRADGAGCFFVRTQTKRRQQTSTGKPQRVRSCDILADVRKDTAQQGAADLTLWVTDQELVDSDSAELVERKICVVSAGDERVYYGAGCAVIKRALDARALKRQRVT